MARINRDTVVAVILLLGCGAFFQASFDIRDMGFESLRSSVWPRMTLGVLAVFCVLYLIKSLRQARPSPAGARPGTGAALIRWFDTYRNAIWCFLAYGLFLVTLDYLGMLIGGILFVFLTLSLLGGWALRNTAVHAAVAVASVSAMWAIFTFGLRVILPEGELISFF